MLILLRKSRSRLSIESLIPRLRFFATDAVPSMATSILDSSSTSSYRNVYILTCLRFTRTSARNRAYSSSSLSSSDSDRGIELLLSRVELLPLARWELRPRRAITLIPVDRSLADPGAPLSPFSTPALPLVVTMMLIVYVSPATPIPPFHDRRWSAENC